MAPAGARLHLSGCAKRCAQPDGLGDDAAVAGPDGPAVTGEGVAVPEDLRAYPAGAGGGRAAMSAHDYIRDGDAIYARSFAIIRAEADLARLRRRTRPRSRCG